MPPRSLRLALTAALLGCGSAPEVRPAPLAAGEQVWRVRYNPAACLRPALALEVETPRGWERVFVEDADEERPLAAELLQAFGAAPDGERRVFADLGREGRGYGLGHAARALRLVDLELPPEAVAEPPAPGPTDPPSPGS